MTPPDDENMDSFDCEVEPCEFCGETEVNCTCDF